MASIPYTGTHPPGYPTTLYPLPGTRMLMEPRRVHLADVVHQAGYFLHIATGSGTQKTSPTLRSRGPRKSVTDSSEDWPSGGELAHRSGRGPVRYLRIRSGTRLYPLPCRLGEHLSSAVFRKHVNLFTRVRSTRPVAAQPLGYSVPLLQIDWAWRRPGPLPAQ